MEYFTLVSKNRENADRWLGMLADIRDAGGCPALAFQPLGILRHLLSLQF